MEVGVGSGDREVVLSLRCACPEEEEDRVVRGGWCRGNGTNNGNDNKK